jgi:hypothetical protein
MHASKAEAASYRAGTQTIILKILAFGAAPHIPQVLIVGPGDRVYHLEKL